MFKKLLKRVIHKMGYIVLKRELPKDMAEDKDFVSILKKIEPFTMVSPDRSFALYQTVKYVVENKIDGDNVECGVWKGGQSMLMAKTLILKNDLNRKMWLYDTYKGMSEPTKHDIYMITMESGRELWDKGKRESHNDWCYASLEEVEKNMSKTGYPLDKIEFMKGKVEDTIPNKIPGKIAVLRLDTDFYESTYHELEYLYPRIVPGGVLYIDDYGSWLGSKKAVDDYIKKHQHKIMLVRVGTSRIGVKVK